MIGCTNFYTQILIAVLLETFSIDKTLHRTAKFYFLPYQNADENSVYSRGEMQDI